MAEDRNKLMQKAEKLVRQGKLEQAIAAYKEVLSDSPKDMNLKNKVGDLCVKAGLNDEAVKVFNEIADFYGREGFYLKAIAMLKKTSKLAPADTTGYLRLADLYAKQGLNNDARSQYQQVSDVFAQAGDHAKAAAALEKATQLDPSNIKLKMRLAELYAKAGLENKSLDAFQGVGDELARTGMFEEALRIYDKGLAGKAAHPGLAAGVVRALTSIGRAREAVQRGSVLAENSEHAGLLAAVADACARVADHGREKSLLESLVRLEPDNQMWQERLGGLAGSGTPATSTPVDGGEALGTAQSEVPDFSEMSGDFTMEELEEVSGQWDGVSLASADAAIASEPGIGATEVEANSQKTEFIAEHMTEAEVFIKYGLVEKAIDNLEAIVSRYPDEAETLRRLKDLYLEAGNKAKAAARCVDLATYHRSRGDAAKAVEMLAEARAHHPSVSFERTKPAEPVLPRGGPSEVEYSFGEVPVEMDSSPPSSGIELDFESPSGSIQLGFENSAAESGGSLSYDLDSGRGEAGAASPQEGGVEFSYDNPVENEHEAIEVSLDESDGAHSAGGGDLGVPVVAAAGAVEPSEGDLSEVTFYIDQGFRDQARSRLEALQVLFPTSQQVADLLVGLDGKSGSGGEEGIEFFEDAIQKPQPREEEPFGLSDSNEDSLFAQENDFFAAPLDAQAETSGASISRGFEDDSIEAIFQEFKKGVEDKVGSEDYETHYNLGIAYREMGLIDEAISEFQLSSKDPAKFIDACSNLGLCFREKGMPKLAIKWYDRALAKLDAGSVQYVAILYDMGQAFEESGDREKALEMYTDVYGLDAGFREVAEKLRMLGS